jgi:hypothetical protein
MKKNNKSAQNSSCATLGALFVLSVVSNFFLSQPGLPSEARVGLILAGIAGPFLGLIGSGDWARVGASDSPERDPLAPLPLWFILGIIFLVIFSRFYRLENLFPWPNDEEGMSGLYALELSNRWNWHVFHTFGQIPPLSIWAAALLLKSGANPWLSLWLPSAVVSLLIVGAGFLAARQFFSKSLSWLVAAWLTVNYWPFSLGRACCEGIWVPLWFLGCVFCLGKLLNSLTARARFWAAIFLGLLLGTGFWTYTPWPIVVVWVGILLGLDFFRGKALKEYWMPLGTAFGVALIPFGWAVYHEGYGQHIQAMSILDPWIPWGQKITASLSYVTVLFWGSLTPISTYAPPSGGFLNPLEDALFFIGLAQCVKSRAPVYRVLALTFFLFLLPGMLSMGTEPFRVVQIIPVLAVLCVLGLIRLAQEIPPPSRPIFLAVLFLLSAAFDVSRVVRSGALDYSKDPVEADQCRTYQILKNFSESSGPGWIFTEFRAHPDETMGVMTHDFNGTWDPSAATSSVRWSALLIDPHYYPFVSPGFTGSQWYWTDPRRPFDKGFVLGLIPNNAQNRPRLERWFNAHAYFRRLSEDLCDINNPESYERARKDFENPPSLIRQDRFLEASYWERRGEFYYDYSYQAHFEDHLDALRQAIDKGYPAAQLYFKLGSLLLRKEDRLGALAAFRAALKADPQYEAAQSGLNLALSQASKTP